MSDGPQSDKRSNHSAAAVLERIADAVFALDEDWRFVYLNERAERLLRADEADLLGRRIWEAFSDAVSSAFRPEFERSMETQESVTFEKRYPALDRRFETRVHPSETGVTVTLRDVTERARERTDPRERALRRAYEVVADPDLSFDEQIEELLTVVRETVGTEYATLSRVHEPTGTYVFEAVDAPEDADLEAGDTVPLEATNCERVVATERTLALSDVAADAPELADRSGNAEWGISSYLGAPVTVGGDVYGSFCFYSMEARAEDFTDWEVTFVELLSNWVSSELERERQNERLDSFASMVAHELRNPLSVAQIYHERAAAGDEDAAEEVATALDRIEELIDVILVTARGAESAIDAEAVALADAAADAWSEVTVDEADLEVETDRAVEADPTHLRHLLENLFVNAVEHGSTSNRPKDDDGVEHGNSRVTVRIGDLPATTGDEDDDASDSPIGFYVADDGSGISDDERGRVFEAGYTTAATDGMGLGLTFVKQLADAYGWDCRITESKEGGARFEFTGVEFANAE